MESDEEDIFAISDEEMSLPTQQIEPVNPVEAHLLEHLAKVESRINAVTNEIAETKAAIASVLNPLEWRALYGEWEDASLGTDTEMYTAKGEPLMKKQRRRTKIEKNLEMTSHWQCILQEKWIIGIELYNRSCWCDLTEMCISKYCPHSHQYKLKTEEENPDFNISPQTSPTF